MAILCNHQRAVSKAHAGQVEKMQGKMQQAMEELHELQEDLKAARHGKDNPKRTGNSEA